VLVLVLLGLKQVMLMGLVILVGVLFRGLSVRMDCNLDGGGLLHLHHLRHYVLVLPAHSYIRKTGVRVRVRVWVRVQHVHLQMRPHQHPIPVHVRQVYRTPPHQIQAQAPLDRKVPRQQLPRA
jgi:hypothetical protein